MYGAHHMSFLSILGADIFRTMERIESNQPYYTTLVQPIIKYLLRTFTRLYKTVKFVQH